MPKTIDIALSDKSIQKAIKRLESYKKNLAKNNRTFVDELGALGEGYVKANSQSTDNDPGSTSRRTIQHGDTATSDVVWSGEQVKFIEFGAGVYFNGNVDSSPHPKGVSMGMLIGKYGHDGDKEYSKGARRAWVKPDGTWTNGTQAMMPMWKAINANDGIKSKVGDVGRKVFDQ